MSKWHVFVFLPFFFLWGSSVFANNVEVKDLKWNRDDIKDDRYLTMTFTLKWDNSWHDDYNHDAVYVFFKYKKKTSGSGSDVKAWNHVYLQDNGNTVSDGYSYWLSPLSSPDINMNTGIYIYRGAKTSGSSEVQCTVVWDIANQRVSAAEQITKNDIQTSNVLISAHALEMVYIPYGPFRAGGEGSKSSFHNVCYPIPSSYDLVDTSYTITGTGQTPSLAADRINDNTSVAGVLGASSAWIGNETGITEQWWRIDFGENNGKKICYFGVNGSIKQPTWYPTEFVLQGSNDRENWLDLWRGPGLNNWHMSRDAYPVERAIRIDPQKRGTYRYYQIKTLGMNAGSPQALSIAMTDRELSDEVRQSVLIDGKTTPVDSLYGFYGDGVPLNYTLTNPIPETFPNGYNGFYVMKYELSQDQYARFLNKLSYVQQQTILGDLIPNKLETLKEGEYIFGDPDRANNRNGIVLTTKIAGMPAVFGLNLNAEDGAALSGDGQNIGCNYMSISDMLAYADWSGLRPLSELEYEKMSRRLYPEIPLRGSYAWGTGKISGAERIDGEGTATETGVAGGGGHANANYGGRLGGPLRVGAFAGTNTTREQAGSSFWGVMDLSGNLSEMYYNVDNHTTGLLLYPVGTEQYAGARYQSAHGDGFLDVNGRYNGCLTGTPPTGVTTSTDYKRWRENIAYIAFRGGSYASDSTELETADRSRRVGYTGALDNISTRDSSVTFRLGRSYRAPRALESVLTLQNGLTTRDGNVSDTICSDTKSYTIVGNKPEGIEDSYVYIWYMREGGLDAAKKGGWRVLEGQTDKDLTYRNFRNNTSDFKYYEFKRRVMTTDADSWASSEKIVTLLMDQAASGAINSYRDTIYEDGYSRGGFYIAMTKPSTFKWIWVKEDGEKELKPTTPANSAAASLYSHYVPDTSDFRLGPSEYSYGDNHIRLERVSSGIASCIVKYDLSVYIKKNEGVVAYISNKVPCGEQMIDERDGEQYGTVKIGNQCWMTENLRYTLAYGGYNPSGIRQFGALYGWYGANGNKAYNNNNQTQGACPAGWVVPNNQDWADLAKFYTDANKEPGKAMKASKYWSYYSEASDADKMKYIGANSDDFAAVGAGWSWGSYAGKFNQVRFWSSDIAGWGGWDGWYAQLDYNKNQVTVTYNWGGNVWSHGWQWGCYVRCIKK